MQLNSCLRDERFFHIYTVIPVLIHYVENIILKIISRLHWMKYRFDSVHILTNNSDQLC